MCFDSFYKWPPCSHLQLINGDQTQESFASDKPKLNHEGSRQCLLIHICTYMEIVHQRLVLMMSSASNPHKKRITSDSIKNLIQKNEQMVPSSSLLPHFPREPTGSNRFQYEFNKFWINGTMNCSGTLWMHNMNKVGRQSAPTNE